MSFFPPWAGSAVVIYWSIVGWASRGSRLPRCSGAMGFSMRRICRPSKHGPTRWKAAFRTEGQERDRLFMQGGTSHLESFDPKPALNKYAGKTIGDTPYKDVLTSPLVSKGVRSRWQACAS